MKNKVVIIGCGNVGMSYAYALLNQKVNVSELALIDLNKNRVSGEVMDLNHCLAYSPSKMKIKVGSYKDCSDAKIIMIAAGVNQKPGEDRLSLLKRNAAIFKDVIKNVMQNNFKGIFLVATNPLDIMTYLVKKYSKVSANRIIGSGTSLDSARLRFMIGDKLHINPSCIHGYVIGEHGDSELVPWSNINVGLQNIADFLDTDDMKKIEDDVRNAAYEIINKKGATYYGIGMSLVRITDAILSNSNSVTAVSCYDKNHDVYYSMPCVLNYNGVKQVIELELNNYEKKRLDKSINVLKSVIKELK